MYERESKTIKLNKRKSWKMQIFQQYLEYDFNKGEINAKQNILQIFPLMISVSC